MDPIDNAVEVLNRLHKADPFVMQNLIFMRVPCNEAVAKDPTIQVGVDHKGAATVGILGIINGLFGVDDRGIGYIYAHLGKSGNVLGFSKNPEGMEE